MGNRLLSGGAVTLYIVGFLLLMLGGLASPLSYAFLTPVPSSQGGTIIPPNFAPPVKPPLQNIGAVVSIDFPRDTDYLVGSSRQTNVTVTFIAGLGVVNFSQVSIEFLDAVLADNPSMPAILNLSGFGFWSVSRGIEYSGEGSLKGILHFVTSANKSSA